CYAITGSLIGQIRVPYGRFIIIYYSIPCNGQVTPCFNVKLPNPTGIGSCPVHSPAFHSAHIAPYDRIDTHHSRQGLSYHENVVAAVHERVHRQAESIPHLQVETEVLF